MSCFYMVICKGGNSWAVVLCHGACVGVGGIVVVCVMLSNTQESQQVNSSLCIYSKTRPCDIGLC